MSIFHNPFKAKTSSAAIVGIMMARPHLPTTNLDLSEEEKYYTMIFDLPGMNKKDIKISIVHSVLTVEAERRKTFGKHRGRLNLPTDVNVVTITASYEGGVLTIKLPKLNTTLPKHTRYISID